MRNDQIKFSGDLTKHFQHVSFFLILYGIGGPWQSSDVTENRYSSSAVLETFGHIVCIASDISWKQCCVPLTDASESRASEAYPLIRASPSRNSSITNKYAFETDPEASRKPAQTVLNVQNSSVNGSFLAQFIFEWTVLSQGCWIFRGPRRPIKWEAYEEKPEI